MKINNNQLRKIFALLKSANQTNDWLHDMLPEWTDGKTSLRDLAPKEADTVVKALENVGKIKPVVKGNRTDKQARTICCFAGKLNYGGEHLSGFIKHTTGNKSYVNDLSVTEASAVITGLKNVLYPKQAKKQLSI